VAPGPRGRGGAPRRARRRERAALERDDARHAGHGPSHHRGALARAALAGDLRAAGRGDQLEPGSGVRLSPGDP
jgi:hypothetical protein